MSNKLTIGQIKKLPVPETGYQEYSAGSIPGLRVRVMSSGIRSWVFRYKSAGKNNVLTLGRVDGLDLKEAEQQAKTYRAQITVGRDPCEELRQTKAANIAARDDETNPTFTRLVALFVEKYALRRLKSWERVKYDLEHYAVPVIGGMRISDIKRVHVTKTLDTMRDRGMTTGSNRVRACMSRCFTWAIQRGWLEYNPVQYTEKLPAKSRDRVLSEDEIRLLFDSTSSGGIMGLCLRFILLSGQRPGEVASLQWADIVDGVWGMSDTKNGKPHKVPISSGMQSVLDDVCDLQGDKVSSSGYVFPGRGNKAMRRSSIGHAMARIAWTCAADAKPRPHDLRRTAITTISMLGFGREVQNAVANHADHSVGGIYDRNPYMKEKRQALEALASEIRRIVDGAQVIEFPQTAGSKRKAV